jgi:hypothetical protein
MNRAARFKSIMLELAKLIHEAVPSSRLFIALCVLLFALVGAALGWVIDRAYHAKLDQERAELIARPETSTAKPYGELKFEVKTVGKNYPEGTILAGIQWKPEYSDDRLRIRNDGNTDVLNLDLVFVLNHEVVKIALFRDYPDARVIPIGLATTSVFVNGVAQPQERITTGGPSRIHCSKIVSQSMVEFIMATNHRAPESQIHILTGSSYEVSGKRYPITVEENYLTSK